MLAYTAKDVGCHIDGAYGEEHRRTKLASMVRAFETAEMQDTRGYNVADALESEPSDDLSEEDDALDILQQFTESGLIWTFEAGDLLLTRESELE